MSSLPQASYYLLYKKHEENPNSLQNQKSKPTSFKHDADDEGSRSFWQEFEWSQAERQTAQEALTENFHVVDILQNNAVGRGQYLIDQFEREAGTYWDNFYKSHQTRFFKDRHYLEKAFPEEFGVVYGKYGSSSKGIDERYEDFSIVEIGCGVGNTVLPLLELDPYITVKGGVNDLNMKRLAVWGLDFSEVAVNLLRKDERYIFAAANNRAQSGVWDITKTHPREVSSKLENSSDISLLLFCLSAVSPEKMTKAAIHVAATLKPGGTLILRDYGRYDEAQMKLGSSRGKRLADNFYVKHDSTRVYFFDLHDLERLFGIEGAGLEIIEIKYIQRIYANRTENSERRRVWVQARFRKPAV